MGGKGMNRDSDATRAELNEWRSGGKGGDKGGKGGGRFEECRSDKGDWFSKDRDDDMRGSRGFGGGGGGNRDRRGDTNTQAEQDSDWRIGGGFGQSRGGFGRDRGGDDGPSDWRRSEGG